jgi:hypothetical protein
MRALRTAHAYACRPVFLAVPFVITATEAVENSCIWLLLRSFPAEDSQVPALACARASVRARRRQDLDGWISENALVGSIGGFATTIKWSASLLTVLIVLLATLQRCCGLFAGKKHGVAAQKKLQ